MRNLELKSVLGPGPKLRNAKCLSVAESIYSTTFAGAAREPPLKGAYRRKYMENTGNPNVAVVFCIIWHLGGSRRVKNTPTGCGNNLPTFVFKM